MAVASVIARADLSYMQNETGENMNGLRLDYEMSQFSVHVFFS